MVLDHGSGGRAGNRLVQDIFLSRLSDPELAALEDSALLELGSGQLAFSTDSYVVDPIFFPGGNIGHLAVHGTVNDLAARGARPEALSLALIIEEGLELSLLEEIVETIAMAAESCGVRIVTGDTKVVPKGKGDRIFINTSGIGVVQEGGPYSIRRLKEGDAILLSGPIGQHGMAVMAARAGIALEDGIGSDTAPLWEMISGMMEILGPRIHAMRDPTRGGLATVLCEMAEASKVEVVVEEEKVPVAPWVRGLSEVMGLDPFYLANEGRMVVAVEGGAAVTALDLMRSHPLGSGAQIIGEVRKGRSGQVVCRTAAGGLRPLRQLFGSPLPRIC